MSFCPCCSNQLVRQISRQKLYWFCLSCRQEMPNFSQLNSGVKVLTLVSGTSKKRSPQKMHFDNSLDTSYQPYESLKPVFAFCPLESLLAANA